MRKIISIPLVLVGIVFVSVMAPSNTVNTETKNQIHSGMGLHVALPNNIKTFPVELPPLP
jgi:hypothetical protein